jgi:glutaminyl-peptide cyclotransferase
MRELDPASGAVRRAVPVPDNYFGEGITVVGDRIWELTYRDGVAVEWDKRTLTPIREVPFAGEGWGLCRDGDRLISSDGSDRLRFHDPANLAETGGVNITRDGQPVTGLNELECVDGQVWANVWPTDTIVRIDPAAGAVTAEVDASALWSRDLRMRGQVLSGIAHIEGQEFMLTGKNWPSMFRVRIDPGA